MKDFPISVASHPILSCQQSLEYERALLGSDAEVWAAMSKAGSALGRAIRFDYGMSRWRQNGVSILGLVGKGHNGGDALLSIVELLGFEGFVGSVTLALTAQVEDLKPQTRRAFEALEKSIDLRVISLADLGSALTDTRFDLCIDGLLGMQFRPPLMDSLPAALALVNGSDRIACRVAVDLPTGVGDESAFRADFTYATGIFKSELLASETAGTIRYLDIGFFEKGGEEGTTRVIADGVLDPLRGFRAAKSEKRQHGHLAILGGSRSMPGALAMSVQAALKSGVGLLTVFAPESIVAQMAVAYPEAMWRTWPETPEGALALEGLWQIRSVVDKASALLLGPGMGRSRETQALLQEVLPLWSGGLLLDADALSEEVLASLKRKTGQSVILTPHDGEFSRMSGGLSPNDDNIRQFARELEVVVVKKGSSTRVSEGRRLFVNPTGNPVLSRGGSGDLLAGLTAGLLAQFPSSPAEVACMGAYWHGKAADALAHELGQTSVRTTDLVDFFSAALEDAPLWNPRSRENRPSGS